MPQVTIKTGFAGPDGSQETLATYFCDVPDCPHPAVEVLGVVKELAASFAVCESHALALKENQRPRG